MKSSQLSFKTLFIALSILCFFSFILFRDLPFFWDAISKARRAQWIYDNNFQTLIVPNGMNSGHPPLWITLLALSWSLFGKTLLASRLLLLVVGIGVIFQLLKLCRLSFIRSIPTVCALFIFLDPTITAQFTNLNNDLLLLFFTLLSLNAVIKQQNIWLVLGLLGVLMTNLRGIYIFIAILIIQIWFVKWRLVDREKVNYWVYLIPGIFFGIFCWFQYSQLGWFIITKSEAYNMHREATGIKGMLVNLGIFAKSFMEYGRFVVLFSLLYFLYKFKGYKIKENPSIARLIISLSVFLGFYFLGMVPFSNPIAPRYFLICYILMTILTVNFLYFFQIKHKIVFLGLAGILLLGGHFWIYPPTFSQPWDSSLAYLNYYDVESQMESFIQRESIDTKDIGTRVGLNGRNLSKLNNVNYPIYSSFDIATNNYILLSNIENYTKDEEFLEVSTNWNLVQSFSKKGVFVSLYKRP